MNRSRILSFAFAAALVLFAFRVLVEFDLPPDPQFGVADAPYSDALTPWLDGTLHYLFYNVPLPNLYRPTVGIFFGSILATYPNLVAIPIFFLGWFFLTLVLAFLRSDMSIRGVLTVWLVLISTPLFFAGSVGASLMGTLMADLPSLAISFAGLLFFALALRERSTSILDLVIATSLIGISAAIRGPFLFLLIPLIFYSFIALVNRQIILGFVPVVCALFLPTVFDSFLQAKYSVINNGMSNLFCVFTHATHTWNPTCHQEFLDSHISSRQLIIHFVQFISTKDGFAVILKFFCGRLLMDARVLASPLFLAAVLSLALPKMLALRKDKTNLGFSLLRCWIPAALWAALFFSDPTNPSNPTVEFLSQPLILCVSIALLIGIGLTRGLVCSPIFLSAYLLCALFVSLVGLPYLGRLSATFSFTLPLGILFFVAEDALATRSYSGLLASEASSLANSLIILFLYLGTFWIPSRLKATFHDRVAGRQAAIKIANSNTLDRSLFYTGKEELYYTHYNPSPIGTVITYSKVDAPDGPGNPTLKNPAKFEETGQ